MCVMLMLDLSIEEDSFQSDVPKRPSVLSRVQIPFYLEIARQGILDTRFLAPDIIRPESAAASVYPIALNI